MGSTQSTWGIQQQNYLKLLLKLLMLIGCILKTYCYQIMNKKKRILLITMMKMILILILIVIVWIFLLNFMINYVMCRLLFFFSFLPPLPSFLRDIYAKIVYYATFFTCFLFFYMLYIYAFCLKKKRKENCYKIKIRKKLQCFFL